jgi:hypothetical protein
MNIQKLASLVRQARKRRQVFLFHDTPRSGIDVPDHDWTDTIQFMSKLFKYFKSQDCQIEISWWGEIFVTLPDYETPFEVSINQTPIFNNVDDSIRAVKQKKSEIIKVQGVFCQYVVSVRPIRQNTKWYEFPIELTNTEPTSLGSMIIKHIIRKVSSYHSQDIEFSKFKKITKNDFIAVVRLGAANFGRFSLMHNITCELKRRIFVNKVNIEHGVIIISSGIYESDSIYPIGKKEMKFFLTYLPDNYVNRQASE